MSTPLTKSQKAKYILSLLKEQMIKANIAFAAESDNESVLNGRMRVWDADMKRDDYIEFGPGTQNPYTVDYERARVSKNNALEKYTDAKDLYEFALDQFLSYMDKE